MSDEPTTSKNTKARDVRPAKDEQKMLALVLRRRRGANGSSTVQYDVGEVAKPILEEEREGEDENTSGLGLEGAKGYALVQVRASAIHPSDLLNSRGGFPYTTFDVDAHKDATRGVPYRILGRDLAGIVQRVSRRSDRHWLQKHVLCTSGYDLSFARHGTAAQYVVVPLCALVEKPQRLSWSQAALLGVPLQTASLMIQRAQVDLHRLRSGKQEGEQEEEAKRKLTLLVLGSTGNVGRMLVRLLQGTAHRIITAARGDKAMLDLTASSTSSASTSSAPGWTDKLKELTDDKGADIIFDCTGSFQIQSAALSHLAKFGTFVFIAAPKGGEAGSTVLGIDMMKVYRLGHSILGVNSLLYDSVRSNEQLRRVVRIIEHETDPLLPQEDIEEVPIQQAKQTYDMLNRKAGKPGKKYCLLFER